LCPAAFPSRFGAKPSISSIAKRSKRENFERKKMQPKNIFFFGYRLSLSYRYSREDAERVSRDCRDPKSDAQSDLQAIDLTPQLQEAKNRAEIRGKKEVERFLEEEVT
jgi:hypothetical protein